MRSGLLLFTTLLATTLLALACASEPEGGGGGTAQATVTFEAGDGASASVLAASAAGTVAGGFEKVSDATGTIEDDRKNVSATYRIRIDDVMQRSGNVVVTVPLAEGMLPPGWNAGTLQPEMQDPGTKAWGPVGAMVVVDAEGRRIAFDVPVPMPPKTPPDEVSSALSARAGALSGKAWDALVRVSNLMLSATERTQLPGPTFAVTWYPSTPASKNSVLDDATWKGTGGADKAVPNFVEDLAAGLEEVYPKLLTLQSSSGPLFSKLSVPQEVYVADCKGSAGESPIGGPMKVSNSQIRFPADLGRVAMHELVHVLQGQHYTRGTMGNALNYFFTGNRWFIEASATFLPAHAAGLGDAERHGYYTEGGYDAYLVEGLACPDDTAVYAAGHFLDWIARKHGVQVVADVMKESGVAVVGLASALKKAGYAEGLSGAFKAYGRELVTKPDGFDGMNGQALGSTLSFLLGYGHLSGKRLDEKRTYQTLTRDLPPMSLSYVELTLANATPGLLVVAAAAPSGLVETWTWDVAGTTAAAYQGRLPLEVPGRPSIAVKDAAAGGSCKAMSQLVANTDFRNVVPVSFAYWLLLPPVAGSPAKGAVTFTTSRGNLPPDRLAGYNVFRMAGDKGVRLGRVPPSAEATLTFANEAIEVGDDIVVQVEDALGNVWPVVKEGETEPVWIGCHSVDDGTDRWGCVRYDTAVTDTGSTAFTDGATATCLGAGYKQYYAFAAAEEKPCRDWCSAKAGADGKCDTPGSVVEPPKGNCLGYGVGTDFCDGGACWNCCDGCEGGRVKLYDCPGGCHTSSWDFEGELIISCECLE
jgi:hypothetical protein